VNRGVAEIELDGVVLEDGLIPLRRDGRRHTVKVVLGQKPSAISVERA
jgi:hypothetical protein